MGGFCGVISKEDCVSDLFFGIDYHSHLGTHRGGVAVLGENGRFLRSIHNIQNAPFRTKFDHIFSNFRGHVGIGVISDTDPQPLVMVSHLGTYALVTVGLISNMDALRQELFDKRHAQLQYSTTSGMLGPTELVSALIASQDTIVDGLKYVQERVEGSLSLLLVTADGTFYAMRDRYGRTPVILGRKEGAMIALQESCAIANLGFEHLRDIGPGEIVKITADGAETVVEPGDAMAICSFLWVYYGFPASTYEGRNVEMARYRCGSYLAQRAPVEADSVGGVPDSGTSHALGYAHESGLKYARPFVKYTPTWARSFMPGDQRQRDRVAAMKLIPIPELIRGKRLIFCDDSIVRGTQLGNQAKRLYHYGAKEAHMRIACPPLLYGCKFINFSRSKSVYDLITRRYIREQEGADEEKNIEKYQNPDSPEYKGMVEYIRQNLGLSSLAFQRLDDLVAAIGLPKNKICTYCFDGKDPSLAGTCPDCPCRKQAAESK
ncbi:MAG: amidophosphoribosyltransferase [Kiritimatiellae bacterium]|nr:amidophosphoribosyltransferase [Kiritimatiellia bacterium]